MAVGTCPQCDDEVHIAKDAAIGDAVSCEQCDANLEIVGLDPVELDVAEDDPEGEAEADAEEDEGSET